MANFSSATPHMSLTTKDQTEKHEKQSKGTILSIAGQALKIIIFNVKVVACIFVPVCLLSFLLQYGVNLLSAPLLEEMFLTLRNDLDPTIEYNRGEIALRLADKFQQMLDSKEFRSYIALQLVKLFFSFVIGLFFLVTTISLSSKAKTEEKVNTKEVFSRVGGRWKRPVITTFYMTLISTSLTLFYFMFIMLVVVMARGTYALVGLVCLASILGIFGYLYVAAIWVLSLVVSILEDNSHGLKAIQRAGELMKGKTVLRGCVIALFVDLACGAIFVTLSSIPIIEDIHRGSVGVMIQVIFLTFLVKFLALVMYTVFYHECKMRHEEAEAEAENGQYAPIACAEV